MAAARQQELVTARRRFWTGHLQGWKQSGLSQAEYCRRQHLSAATFGWWKTRLTALTLEGSPAVSTSRAGGKDRCFVELAVAGGGTGPTAAEKVYEIILASGRQLRLGRHFEPERVRQLLRVLEDGC